MISSRPIHLLAVLGVVMIHTVALAQEPLLQRADDGINRRGRVARVAKLALGRVALGQLRASTQSTLTEFPLGASGSATLEIERFEPFSPDAKALLMTTSGARELQLPEQVYFRGRVAGDKTSRVLIVAGSDFVRGFVADGTTTHRFGPDAQGAHLAWSLSDADADSLPTAPLCGNDAFAEVLAKRPSPRQDAAMTTQARNQPRGPYAPTLLSEIYLETDQELLELFVDADEALAYLADLAAAVSTIYDADADVRVVFRTIRLWESTDPWKGRSLGSMLDEVSDYWTLNEGTTPRDLVHFVSGKGVAGGLAYLDVLCDPDFGYGVSTVFGSFDVLDPSDTWDVTVLAHELGHNFGSAHTHCYDPPVDGCYAAESGCYDGPTSLPPGGGTIMSYCHLLPGGGANVNLTFGSTVSDVLRTGATGAACIGDPCGDGILDPGEACDDGNVDGGDCCAADCSSAAVDGNACDDGESCTTSDQCTAGTCNGTAAVDGSPCDDGSLCTSESCAAGECAATAAPAVGCLQPSLPLAAQLSLKNVAGGRSDSLALKWNKGAATLLADFGDPLATDDYELCIYDADADVVLAARIPAGGTCAGKPCWKGNTLGFTYNDKERTPDGISKVSLKAGDAGRAKVALKGKGEPLKMTPVDEITLPVVAQLRRSGRCWGSTYSTAIKHTDEQLKAKSD